MRGDEVVGTTAIEVQEPDELDFVLPLSNLSFKQSSDLGLTAKYKTRAMELGGYVFGWTITPASTDQKPADIGTFDGNTFTAIKAKDTRSATVTVSYKKADSTVMTDTISLEIGRMPTVLFDFEPDAEGNLLKVGNSDWGNASYGNAFGDENMELTDISWDDETPPGTVPSAPRSPSAASTSPIFTTELMTRLPTSSAVPGTHSSPGTPAICRKIPLRRRS